MMRRLLTIVALRRIFVLKLFITLCVMIRTFTSKTLEALFCKNDASGLPTESIRKIIRLLDLLDTLQNQNDIPRSYKPHPLKGRKGYLSVWVTGNWRITFCIKDQNVYDVDYEDYH